MSQMICIGKIEQTYCQAHAVPFPDPKKYNGNHAAYGRIKVGFRRAVGTNNNVILVTDATGREFGRVDHKTANAIAALMDAAHASGLKWVAWTDPRKKGSSDPTTPGDVHHALISMTVQLYCPRKNAHGMGVYLKGRNTRLTRPVFEIDKYDYFNPQTQEAGARNQLQHP